MQCMVRQKRETSNRNVNKKYKKHKCNVTHIILPPVSPPDFHPVFQPPTPPLFTYSGFLCSRKVKISRLCVPRFHFCFCIVICFCCTPVWPDVFQQTCLTRSEFCLNSSPQSKFGQFLWKNWVIFAFNVVSRPNRPMFY